jgi:hypothetical protein
MNIFENASRVKSRFNSVQGALTVEQLWDLPLTTTRSNVASLNALAIEIQKEINGTSEITFVKSSSTSKENKELKEKLEILVHIIEVRESENQAALDAKAIKSKKAAIEELIAKKQEEAMGDKSIEELQAELAALTA